MYHLTAQHLALCRCPATVCPLQALSWTFYLLMQHPEVEAKLLQEVHQVLGATAGGGGGGVVRPSYDQLRQLRYARAVFMEAARLYPSVPEVRWGWGGATGCSLGLR